MHNFPIDIEWKDNNPNDEAYREETNQDYYSGNPDKDGF
jgi:hypothetical protein